MYDRNDQMNMDPWDRDYYETGSTRPPKSRRGLVTFLLGLVILLSGITSVLGILNIKLVTGNDRPKDQDLPLSVVTDSTADTADTGTETAPPVTFQNGEEDQLNINNSPTSVENIPQPGGLSYQEIYTQTIDSVVSITCSRGNSATSGSGVILSEKGYIVTNAHVVADALSIAVELTDGRRFAASIVGSDELTDLAVLYIQADQLKAAEFGDSEVLRVGDAVAAIGDPLGSELRGSMTPGIVSGINRVITTEGRTMTLIQTNAALNSGNSGGPLLNCFGQVIGINTMKMADSVYNGNVEGIGFAIPSTTVKEIVDQLLLQGYVSGRPTLGIKGEQIPTIYQRYYGLPNGLYITGVDKGSGAQLGGISPGDVLVSIDGIRVTSADELQSLLHSREPGETVKLVIYRNRRYVEITLTLEESKK